MKKLVTGFAGLVGIVFGFGGISCTTTIHDKVTNIRYYSNEIRKIIKVGPEESILILGFEKGVPYNVSAWGKDSAKLVVYFDLDDDGEYDHRKTIEKSNMPDIRVLPPPDPNSEKQRNDYLQKKRNYFLDKLKKGLLVSHN